jgi:ribonucleoside-diphosphate reductase alpha chain
MVTKRNGHKEPFDIQKIKDMLQWACEGLDVSPLQLESSLTVTLKDGVSTKEIHQNSVQISTSLIDVETPDWRYVAGRLHVGGYTKDVETIRGFGYGSTKKFVEYQQSRGVYDKNITFTDEEYEFADHLIDPEFDMLFDIAGATALTDRYCLSNELPQEMFLIISMLVAKQLEKMYGFDFYEFTAAIYIALGSLELSASTPILLNLRRPNANLSSCYIIKPSDDMGSIYDRIKDLAMISKHAGGVGFNLDSIRGCGSYIKNVKGAASGVVPLVKVLNDTAVYVNQEGKRAGAVSPSISAWHIDVIDFLDIQLEEGDFRRKSFDVMPQIVYNDLFFERCDEDKDWTMFDPYELKTVLGIDLSTLHGEEFKKAYLLCESMKGDGELRITRTIRARDLFKAHYKASRISGMPYVTFKDTIQKGNPNKHAGVIYGANICVESFSNFEEDKLSHVCNLVSVNIARCIRPTHEETYDRLFEVSKLCTYFLDATLELGNPPIDSAKAHNDIYRSIGVGGLGLADYMAFYGLSYETESGREEASKIMELISGGAVDASATLAERSEPYAKFEGSEWEKGNLLGRDWDEFIICILLMFILLGIWGI